MLLHFSRKRHTPIQFTFADKTHPRDHEAKKFNLRIVEITHNPRLFGRLVFLKNYDMNIGRFEISGAKVWLNAVRRPRGASGTSGMKIAIHGREFT